MPVDGPEQLNSPHQERAVENHCSGSIIPVTCGSNPQVRPKKPCKSGIFHSLVKELMQSGSRNRAKTDLGRSRSVHRGIQNFAKSRLHQGQFLTPDRPGAFDVQRSLNFFCHFRHGGDPLPHRLGPGSLGQSQGRLGGNHSFEPVDRPGCWLRAGRPAASIPQRCPGLRSRRTRSPGPPSRHDPVRPAGRQVDRPRVSSFLRAMPAPSL